MADGDCRDARHHETLSVARQSVSIAISEPETVLQALWSFSTKAVSQV